MNRNTNIFAYNKPYLDISRAKFFRNFDHKTTINAARLVPIYVDELLPGDSVKINLSSLVRMSTPIFPVMDQAYMDIYFFAVPERLVYDNFAEMMGENKTDYWTQEIEYEMPTVKNALEGGWKKGSIADYMGIEPGKNLEVRADFFRAYALIYNEWFRDENLVEPQHIYTDATNRTITELQTDTEQAEFGLDCCKVAKFADYFTTCLPNAQKSDPVLLPLGTKAPVYPEANIDNTSYIKDGMRVKYWDGTDQSWKNIIGNNYNVITGQKGPTSSVIGIDPAAATVSGFTEIAPYNLMVDLSNATAATVEQLRQAFQVQKLFERDAIGGTRYTEMLRAHFGVTSPDARQQRPEYIGGKRIRINVSQVIQQSSTDATSPQGNTAAYSLTVDRSDMVKYSSTEHQLIIGLACIRTDHTYQQGLARMWGRRKRFDWYWPVFANLGNQFVRNEEIYAQGTDEDKEAFGYQEAWAEYRYAPSRISGEFRSSYAQSLDAWHYGDDFESLPTLSKDFIEETDANILRTLAVQQQDQFICDFYFNQVWTRPMPVNSVPGLIDHH